MNGVEILMEAITKVKVYHISPVQQEPAVPLIEIKKIVEKALIKRQEDLNDTPEATVVS